MFGLGIIEIVILMVMVIVFFSALRLLLDQGISEFIKAVISEIDDCRMIESEDTTSGRVEIWR